jgi:hypothetical protein
MPHASTAVAVSKHIKQYFGMLQEAYYQFYQDSGAYGQLPTPMDKTGFWLDDSLPYATHDIGGGVFCLF